MNSLHISKLPDGNYLLVEIPAGKEAGFTQTFQYSEHELRSALEAYKTTPASIDKAFSTLEEKGETVLQIQPQ